MTTVLLGPTVRTTGLRLRGADAARVLGGLRLLVGVGSWLSPTASARTFGLGATADPPGAGLTMRLFGVRDAALAANALTADPVVRRAALRTGVVVDAVDSVATLLALRAGAPRAAGPLVGVGTLVFCALGTWALQAAASDTMAPMTAAAP